MDGGDGPALAESEAAALRELARAALAGTELEEEHRPLGTMAPELQAAAKAGRGLEEGLLRALGAWLDLCEGPSEETATALRGSFYVRLATFAARERGAPDEARVNALFLLGRFLHDRRTAMPGAADLRGLIGVLRVIVAEESKPGVVRMACWVLCEATFRVRAASADEEAIADMLEAAIAVVDNEAAWDGVGNLLYALRAAEKALRAAGGAGLASAARYPRGEQLRARLHELFFLAVGCAAEKDAPALYAVCASLVQLLREPLRGSPLLNDWFLHDHGRSRGRGGGGGGGPQRVLSGRPGAPEEEGGQTAPSGAARGGAGELREVRFSFQQFVRKLQAGARARRGAARQGMGMGMEMGMGGAWPGGGAAPSAIALQMALLSGVCLCAPQYLLLGSSSRVGAVKGSCQAIFTALSKMGSYAAQVAAEAGAGARGAALDAAAAAFFGALSAIVDSLLTPPEVARKGLLEECLADRDRATHGRAESFLRMAMRMSLSFYGDWRGAGGAEGGIDGHLERLLRGVRRTEAWDSRGAVAGWAKDWCSGHRGSPEEEHAERVARVLLHGRGGGGGSGSGGGSGEDGRRKRSRQEEGAGERRGADSAEGAEGAGGAGARRGGEELLKAARVLADAGVALRDERGALRNDPLAFLGSVRERVNAALDAALAEACAEREAKGAP